MTPEQKEIGMLDKIKARLEERKRIAESGGIVTIYDDETATVIGWLVRELETQKEGLQAAGDAIRELNKELEEAREAIRLATPVANDIEWQIEINDNPPYFYRWDQLPAVRAAKGEKQ